MNDEQKRIAYKAIDDNVEASTARQIIRYVLECEIFRQDTISPSIEYLAKKYAWSKETTKVAISKAKRSQFITTTGYGKGRCFELNVGFLKAKMAEVYQKSLRPMADFSDVLPEGKTNTLANSSANSLANTLANSFDGENGLTEPQNHQNEGDNNNSNNYNLGEQSSQGYEIVKEKETETHKPDKKDTSYLAVFQLWGAKYPLNWRVNRAEIQAAKNILAERGLKNASDALAFARKHSKDEYCPQIDSPCDLDRKWNKLSKYEPR